jgi:hypothetical protein
VSAFSCPNLDLDREFCLKVQTDCVPGRPGCVLRTNSVFAVPAEERIRQKEEAKKKRPSE